MSMTINSMQQKGHNYTFTHTLKQRCRRNNQDRDDEQQHKGKKYMTHRYTHTRTGNCAARTTRKQDWGAVRHFVHFACQNLFQGGGGGRNHMLQHIVLWFRWKTIINAFSSHLVKLNYSNELHRPFPIESSFGSGEQKKLENEGNLLTTSEHPCVASSFPQFHELFQARCCSFCNIMFTLHLRQNG